MGKLAALDTAREEHVVRDDDGGAGYPDHGFGDADAEIAQFRCKDRGGDYLQRKFHRAARHGNELSANALKAAAKHEQKAEHEEERDVPNDVFRGGRDDGGVGSAR